MPKRSGRFFFAASCVLLSLILAASGLFAAVLSRSGIGLIRFPDGAVMLGEQWKAADARPPVSPPITIPVAGPAEPGGALSFNEIYKKAAPSVAAIISQSDYSSGTGTGIVITGDGYILTNHHVVENASVITVLLNDGSEYQARLVGSDRLSDLALLKIGASGLTPAEFGDSDAMEHGDPVAAIGNPLGIDLRNTITTGVISGVNRDIKIEDAAGDITMSVLQTNCAVNPGNSGGPLLNQYGQVIGIISSKIMSSASQTIEGLGFAIPGNTAAPLAAQLLEHGYIRGRPAIGITFDPSYKPGFGLPPGVYVKSVDERADAYGKLTAGDIITHIDGIAVTSAADIGEIKNGRAPGEALRLTVYRRGEELTVIIILMEEGYLQT